MELRVNGQCIRVVQAGGGRLIFDRPTTVPDSHGEFIMHVDGHEQRWRVKLQTGDQPQRIVHAEFEAQ